MSLNKTLDRLFDEIRREAKRNPDFADRLDAVLRLHASRREVADDLVDVVAKEADSPPTAPGRGSAAKKAKGAAAPSAGGAPAVHPAPQLNPAGFYKREGEEALRQALEAQDFSGLRALVAEHNLDPGGVTAALTREELAAHILEQAKRRAERDDKMFDY